MIEGVNPAGMVGDLSRWRKQISTYGDKEHMQDHGDSKEGGLSLASPRWGQDFEDLLVRMFAQSIIGNFGSADFSRNVPEILSDFLTAYLRLLSLAAGTGEMQEACALLGRSFGKDIQPLAISIHVQTLMSFNSRIAISIEQH